MAELYSDQANTLAEITGEGADNSVLSNLSRLISRPGWALRSALSGDIEGAARNVGQLVLDLPTGGFLDRRLNMASLANVLLPKAYELPEELTTRQQRPEFTDLLGRWGVASPESMGWGERLALDVVGGAFTDPLTLLGGGGGLRAGALSGLGRGEAQAAVAQALKETLPGRAALESAQREVLGDVLGRFSLRAERAGRARTALSLEDLTATQRARIERAIEGRAAENVFWGRAPGVEVGPRVGRFGETLGADSLDAGLRALEADGLAKKAGHLYWKFPFQDVARAKSTGATWGAIGRFGTAPGWAREIALNYDKTRPLVQAADTAVSEAIRWVQGNLYDRRLWGKVPDGLREAARSGFAKRQGAERTADELVHGAFRGFTPEEREAMGRIWSEAADTYQELIGSLDELSRPGTMARAARGAVGAMAGSAAAEGSEALAHFGRGRRAAQEILGVAANPGAPLDAATRARALELIQGEQGRRVLSSRVARQAIEDAITAVGGEARRADVERAMGIYTKTMAEIPPELHRLGRWSDSKGNPFYLPHQAQILFHQLASEAFDNEPLQKAIGSVFEKGRKHLTQLDYANELKRIANEHNVPFEALDDLQNLDIADLMRMRLYAHARTVERAELWNKATRLGMKRGDDFHRYVLRQFEDSYATNGEGFMAKLAVALGGGKVRMPVGNASPEWRELAEKRGWLRKVDGEQIAEINWPGINWVYKPLLTSHPQNVGFHVRNVASAVAMGLFDNQIGGAVGARVLPFVKNSGVVRTLTREGWSGDEIANFVRAMSPDLDEAARGADAVRALGKRVGNYTATEVLGQVKNLLGRRGVSQADLMGQLSEIDRYGHLVQGQNASRIRQGFDWWTRLGEKISNHVENSFRINAYMQLIEKGVRPTDAVRRVGKAFVDYSVNSQTEYVLRQVIPFARFSIGSAAWLRPMAERPLASVIAARARYSAEGIAGSEGTYVPEQVRESLALPLPWRDEKGNMQFLTSLGFPHEVAVQVLGLTTPVGLRRTGLGGIHPVLRLPSEATVNRSFYFGSDWGEYRKAPNWLPDALTEEVKLPGGRIRREIEGPWNELMGALPTSRLGATLNKIMDERRSSWDKVFNAVTGARTLSVDQKAELKKKLVAYLQQKASAGQVGKVEQFFSRLDPEDTPEDLKLILQTLRETKKRPKEGSP